MEIEAKSKKGNQEQLYVVFVTGNKGNQWSESKKEKLQVLLSVKIFLKQIHWIREILVWRCLRRLSKKESYHISYLATWARSLIN